MFFYVRTNKHVVDDDYLNIGCVISIVRLATTLLKDEESARNDDVLACNFAKYSLI